MFMKVNEIYLDYDGHNLKLNPLNQSRIIGQNKALIKIDNIEFIRPNPFADLDTSIIMFKDKTEICVKESFDYFAGILDATALHVPSSEL